MRLIAQEFAGIGRMIERLGQPGGRCVTSVRIQPAVKLIVGAKGSRGDSSSVSPKHLASLRVASRGGLVKKLFAAKRFPANVLMAEIQRGRGHEFGIFRRAGAVDK